MKRKNTVTEELYLQRVNAVVEYINENLDKPFDLEKLANMSGFSPWHFHRIIKAYLGEPLGAYVIRVRMEAAARMLRHSRTPVQEIAWRMGYDAPSSLSKTFSAFYGVSPTFYRNNKNYVIMKPQKINKDLDIIFRNETVEPKTVVYKRYKGSYTELDYCGGWQSLFGYLGRKEYKGMEIVEPEYICIYHDDPKVTEQDKLRTDICLTVDRNTAPEPEGEFGIKEIKGGKYGIFTYQGPYENLDAVYDTIYGHMLPELGMTPSDNPGFEKYLNSPVDTKPEDLVTEIHVPL